MCTVNSVQLSTLPFIVDQLTVERARNVVKSRVNSSSPAVALEGLQPAICDWHAECVLLQVCHVYVWSDGQYSSRAMVCSDVN